MSENHWRVINQLLTASMLVVALIACQQMPENNNSNSVKSNSNTNYVNIIKG
jgi:hypothetical protein